MTARLALVLTAFIALTACKTAHQGAYEVAAQGAAIDNAALIRAGADALWNERGDAEKLKQSIAAYEQLAAADPNDADALTHVVRGYYFLADGHLADPAEKLAAYDASVLWGKRCLATNAEFKSLLEKGDETEGSAARVLTVREADCLYWTSAALGKWAKAQGIAVLLANKDTVKLWMERVEQLVGPEYFYGATSRYWGAYFAALPSFAGQDLNKSLEYFDKAIAVNPGHFGNHVLKAEYWAVKTQNRAAFESELNLVINGDANALADVIPEQIAEQAKAKALLGQIDDLFVE